jgi:hypothetical protein
MALYHASCRFEGALGGAAFICNADAIAFRSGIHIRRRQCRTVMTSVWGVYGSNWTARMQYSTYCYAFQIYKSDRTTRDKADNISKNCRMRSICATLIDLPGDALRFFEMLSVDFSKGGLVKRSGKCSLACSLDRNTRSLRRDLRIETTLLIYASLADSFKPGK